MWWKALIVAFAVVCAGACTGSSGDGAPSSLSIFPPPTVSTPASPTPTAPTVPADVPTTGPNLRYRGEKPPVEPLAALEHSAAGAKAFAEFFIKTIDWGFATTSSTYMRHYFEPSCTECINVRIALDRAHARKERFVGDRFSVRRSSVDASAAHIYTVAFTLDVSSEELIDQNGKFVSGDAALNNYRESAEVTWAAAGWRVVRMVPQ